MASYSGQTQYQALQQSQAYAVYPQTTQAYGLPPFGELEPLPYTPFRNLENCVRIVSRWTAQVSGMATEEAVLWSRAEHENKMHF